MMAPGRSARTGGAARISQPFARVVTPPRRRPPQRRGRSVAPGLPGV